MRPLCFLVADKNMEFAVRGFFGRKGWHYAVGCHPIEFDYQKDMLVAVGRADPGIYSIGDQLLRPFRYRYRHAVVMVDEQWEGSPGGQQIRRMLEDHLEREGWGKDDSLALVLRPELDMWLWTDSPHSAKALGWESWSALKKRLVAEGWLQPGQTKPARPKEAAEWALRHAPQPRPRSSTIYREISSRVSLGRCVDPAFRELAAALRAWFPAAGPDQRR